jgi:hypothetical protein
LHCQTTYLIIEVFQFYAQNTCTRLLTLPKIININ